MHGLAASDQPVHLACAAVEFRAAAVSVTDARAAFRSNQSAGRDVPLPCRAKRQRCIEAALGHKCQAIRERRPEVALYVRRSAGPVFGLEPGTSAQQGGPFQPVTLQRRDRCAVQGRACAGCRKVGFLANRQKDAGRDHLAVFRHCKRMRPGVFPGNVITPDGATYIVGESFSSQFTAFDLGPDGRLDNRRLWAAVPGTIPDGCCYDAEGGIWYADAIGRAALRVCEGGEITHRVETELNCFAVMLGGDDRRTLFLVTAPGSHPDEVQGHGLGRIETVSVEIPGVGLP